MKKQIYAEVVINLPVEGTFSYHIPAELAGRLEAGQLVEVQFGPQRAQGVILNLSLESPVAETKPILRVIEGLPILYEAQRKLAEWLRDTYLAPYSACVRLFMPPGLSKQGDILITPTIAPEWIEAENRAQKIILNKLTENGSARGRQIARSLPRQNWRKAIKELEERGVILRDYILAAPTVARPKRIREVVLTIFSEEVEGAIQEHFNFNEMQANWHKAAQRRSDVLRLLVSKKGGINISSVYAQVDGINLSELRKLEALGLVQIYETEVNRDPLAGIRFVSDTPPKLTHHQAEAWEQVRISLNMETPPQPILLHGVTGSGKTEVYLRAVEEVMEQGRSAIVLVPEIALTPQTVQRFGARFPGRIGLLHSRLSAGERYDTWRRIRAGELDVVIGARSALFAPLENIGVIIIDECHDDSYKQGESPMILPSYRAIPAAIELARVSGGLVIMGSATPTIIDYAQAASPDGAYTLLELPARVMGHRKAIEQHQVYYRLKQTSYTHHPDDPEEAVMIDLPPVQIVDMRQELRAGNRSIFSRILQRELAATLDRGEQAILYLNRRGSATYVFCRACGYTHRCPHCEIPLTWHNFRGSSSGKLVCHHCNHREDHPKECKECGSDQIRFFGGGTERVEKEVLSLFPQAEVIRWDQDTTGGKDSHAILLEAFIRGEANVLVGTQMVAKGLDLPLVTLVGVISADTALYLPDYRSGERAFQLLTQVAGRAGRGLLGGQVIIQTYAPDHYAIEAASKHDFHSFYQQELHKRGDIGYPPYSRLARLLIYGETAEEVKNHAEKLYEQLTQLILDTQLHNTNLIGPAPCFYPRQRERYRWQIIIKGANPTTLLRRLPPSRHVMIDIDPVSLL